MTLLTGWCCLSSRRRNLLWRRVKGSQLFGLSLPLLNNLWSNSDAVPVGDGARVIQVRERLDRPNGMQGGAPLHPHGFPLREYVACHTYPGKSVASSLNEDAPFTGEASVELVRGQPSNTQGKRSR